jgi:hypothetical protein
MSMSISASVYAFRSGYNRGRNRHHERVRNNYVGLGSGGRTITTWFYHHKVLAVLLKNGHHGIILIRLPEGVTRKSFLLRANSILHRFSLGAYRIEKKKLEHISQMGTITPWHGLQYFHVTLHTPPPYHVSSIQTRLNAILKEYGAA